MKRPAVIIAIITTIVSCLLQSQGAKHDVRFSVMGIDKGLSHSTVNGISQDRLGYIWVATPDGLNRYDGNRFVTFVTDSIDHNIRAVANDIQGDIWIITAGTLSRHGTLSDKFDIHKFPNKATLTTIMPVDADRIAVGTDAGLYMFSKSNNKFIPVSNTGQDHITAITLFNGNVIYGTYEGKIRRLYNGKLTDIGNAGCVEVNVLLPDKNRLLAGTEGMGLYSYEPTKRYLERMVPDSPITYVRSLLVDSLGRLWVGTFTGLYIIDSDRKKVIRHETASGSDGALSHSSVRRMFADSQGGIWLGTYFGGLNYYHPQLTQFTTLTPNLHDNRSLSGNVAGPLAQDPAGRIWIGTNSAGLNIYDPATGEFVKRTQADGLGSNDIKAIFIDESEQRVYVGTHIGGLTILGLSGGGITPHGEVASSVYDIVPAKTPGHLWLATLDCLSLLNTSTYRAVRFTPEGMPKITTNLMRDRKGRLWVGGEDGLAVFAENDGKLTLQKKLPRLGFHVNDVVESRTSDVFWIATHRGLYRYQESTGRMQRLGTAEGLPGDIIYAVLEDPSSNIWITTNRGLACLNHSDMKIQIYSNRDGLGNSQFSDRSALSASNGLMYFGGLNGLTYFNPTVMDRNNYAPIPVIEGIRLFNNPVTPGDETGILKKGIHETSKLVFDASQTNFTIDFTTCDFISKGDNSFQYMLDGIDTQWITAPKGVRSVTYSNLPAGTYTFRLRAANNDGVWSDKEATVKIQILPPWYATWWAITLLVLVIITAGYFATRYVWKRQLLEKQRNAQHEVNEMKVRFFVNMSHELRTPLTLMLLPLTELIDSRPGPVIMQKLSTIRNNTMRIRHIVNQLLDYRRAELGMFRLAVAPQDINLLVADLLESYKSVADNKHIKFNFNSTIAGSTAYVDANYIELIVNNLVTNAFKYTPDGGKITVDLSETDGKLLLDVSDNGCGIPSDKINTIFTRFYQVNDSAGGYGIGLSLVKRLVELHHGTITVDSTVGQGSRFTVTIPVRQSDYKPEEIAEQKVKRDIRNEDISALLPMDEETEATETNAETPDECKTVLVVDDNAEILKYLSEAMTDDFRVLTAANGTKAIEVLGSDNVDLVISDVMMPDMDGVQLCRAIKRNLRTSHIPVLLLSAKADIVDRLDGLKVGADDYIPKPFLMDELLAKVRNLIRTRESIIRHYSQNSTAEIEPSKMAQNPLDEEFLSKATKIMDEHLDDSEFTTDMFARQMCMSRSNLHLKMKALTGESTNDFIRRTRLRKAAELLKTRRYTVAEVSAMVGYNTPSYFATAFKNFFGASPSSLLNKN